MSFNRKAAAMMATAALTQPSRHRLDRHIGDEAEPDPGGDRVAQRHHQHDDQRRNVVGRIVEAERTDARGHQEGDEQQRGGIKRHGLCQRRQEQGEQEKSRDEDGGEAGTSPFLHAI
jgi:hypothetical protein